MTTSKTLLLSYRTLFGLLGAGTLVSEILNLVTNNQFNLINFLSYFTMENNILVSVVFLLSALAIATGKHSRVLEVLRGLSAVFIVVVALGYGILLGGWLEGTVLATTAWNNTVFHYIMPLAALLDLLIDRPRTSYNFKKSLWWLLFPATFIGYSLTRGALTGWYPYSFLDPSTQGYGSIAVTVAGLLTLCVVLIWCATKVPSKKS